MDAVIGMLKPVVGEASVVIQHCKIITEIQSRLDSLRPTGKIKNIDCRRRGTKLADTLIAYVTLENLGHIGSLCDGLEGTTFTEPGDVCKNTVDANACHGEELFPTVPKEFLRLDFVTWMIDMLGFATEPQQLASRMHVPKSTAERHSDRHEGTGGVRCRSETASRFRRHRRQAFEHHVTKATSALHALSVAFKHRVARISSGIAACVRKALW